VLIRHTPSGSLAGVRMIRSTSGQGSVEYVGLIAVVALVVVVSGAALAQASGVSRRVTRQWARALCLVGHGDCRRDQEPCVTSSQQTRDGWRAHLVVVRLDRAHVALVQRRSDGTVAVSWAKERATGISREAGVGAQWHALGIDAELGAQLSGGGAATVGEGRTWILPSQAAADALLARVRHGGDGVPPPDVVYRAEDDEGRYGVTLAARAGARGIGVSVAEAGGELALLRSTGARLDRRTGHRTLYARTASEAAARAGLAGGLLEAGTGTGREGELFALELDEHGEPLELAVTARGRYAGSAGVPAVLSPVAGRLPAASGGARTFEVTTHLDLTVPANLAAAGAVLGPLRAGELRFGHMLAAAQALRERLATGTIEARVYDDSATSGGWSAIASAGGKAGFEGVHDVEGRRLVTALSRGLDGQWLVREDCATPA
jgi:hypothetical protein